jgi:hypothetical protein
MPCFLASSPSDTDCVKEEHFNLKKMTAAASTTNKILAASTGSAAV